MGSPRKVKLMAKMTKQRSVNHVLIQKRYQKLQITFLCEPTKTKKMKRRRRKTAIRIQSIQSERRRRQIGPNRKGMLNKRNYKFPFVAHKEHNFHIFLSFSIDSVGRSVKCHYREVDALSKVAVYLWVFWILINSNDLIIKTNIFFKTEIQNAVKVSKPIA